MTAKELRRKHKKNREMRRIEKAKSFIISLIFLLGVVAFTGFAITMWDREIQEQGNYNRIYQEQRAE